jgi:hypothetical protein
LREHLGKSFPAIVRRVDSLRAILESDPYQAFRLPPRAKRVVTFLRARPRARLALPIALGGAQSPSPRARG